MGRFFIWFPTRQRRKGILLLDQLGIYGWKEANEPVAPACDNLLLASLLTGEGKAHLEEIRQILFCRTTTEVSFSDEIHFIATTAHLDDGETFAVFQSSLEVEAMCEQIEDALEREYYVTSWNGNDDNVNALNIRCSVGPLGIAETEV